MGHHMERLVREVWKWKIRVLFIGSDNKEQVGSGDGPPHAEAGQGGGSLCLLLHHRGRQAGLPGGPAGFQWQYSSICEPIFQIRAHRSLLCLVSQQWRSLLEFCPDSEVLAFSSSFAHTTTSSHHFLSKASSWDPIHEFQFPGGDSPSNVSHCIPGGKRWPTWKRKWRDFGKCKI